MSAKNRLCSSHLTNFHEFGRDQLAVESAMKDQIITQYVNWLFKVASRICKRNPDPIAFLPSIASLPKGVPFNPVIDKSGKGLDGSWPSTENCIKKNCPWLNPYLSPHRREPYLIGSAPVEDLCPENALTNRKSFHIIPGKHLSIDSAFFYVQTSSSWS